MSNAPGLPWNAADSCSSTPGTMYVESPLNCGSRPDDTRQYGLAGVTAELRSPAPNVLVPVVAVESSGRFARTSQLSATVCPALDPATRVKPRSALTWTLTSTPLKCCDQRPNWRASVTRLETWPSLSGTTS